MDEPLWQPSPAQIEASQVERFRHHVNRRLSLDLSNYEELYAWSCDRYDQFWGEVWHFCGVVASKQFETVVDMSKRMDEFPAWFPEARLNWAENMLQERSPDKTALIQCIEPEAKGTSPIYHRMSYAELYDDVRRAAHALKKLGVKPLDRVGFYGPNCTETTVACLAATALGAIWSSTASDFGSEGVLSRFEQIKPDVLISANAVQYNGKKHSHLPKLRAVLAGLQKPEISPNLEVILIDFLKLPSNEEPDPSWRSWRSLLEMGDDAPPEIDFYQAPFDHPLWICFSSGTTGNPKAIVHRAGGMLLQSKKEHLIHGGLGPDDIYFFFTSPGWMIWNMCLQTLSLGCTVVLYDGSPFFEPGLLWRMAEDLKFTVFGTSAKYIEVLSKLISPKDHYDLSSLRQILSTGSPLVADLFDWVYANIKSDLLLGSITGGTDICSCFAGQSTALPVYRGELQCRMLGMAIECFNEQGQIAAPNEEGDLVCTRPFPCMPVYFWNDPTYSKYRASYFERFPGVWVHGDYCKLTPSRQHNGGGLVMLGRSDGVLNPQGVRFGSSELYGVLDAMDDTPIEDALAVGLQLPSGDERVVMFVKLHPGRDLSPDFVALLKTEIRTRRSARHIPSDFIVVKDIPYTANNKKVEVPVKKLLNGAGLSAINPSTLRNPDCLDEYLRLGAELRAIVGRAS